jgi:hypothetical protein
MRNTKFLSSTWEYAFVGLTVCSTRVLRGNRRVDGGYVLESRVSQWSGLNINCFNNHIIMIIIIYSYYNILYILT